MDRGYCYDNHGENFRTPGATLTNRAPNDCTFTFVCSKLEGNPCGDYGVEIGLGDGHSEQVILVWPCLTFDPIMTFIWYHLTVIFTRSATRTSPTTGPLPVANPSRCPSGAPSPLPPIQSAISGVRRTEVGPMFKRLP